MDERDRTGRIVQLGDGAPRREQDFEIVPNAQDRAALAEALGILAVRKLRFTGRLVPISRRDWTLEAKLGASVVQECGVTLAPVTSRIEETVRRRFLTEMPQVEAGGEVEMPEDETIEPLPQSVDLTAVLHEALALALPPFPRAEGADLGEAVFTEPGKAPMRDEDARPFADLAALRDKLAGKD
ncbi:YceD family protein [Profundibacterium mesophilum]|uniref:DUF177 domain-containing protein n=1 Tax=Profundibacterium mesophilum KAUST100406-0324 TaxID=1037889 RepID=A0A921NRR5_9RHOB|nr:DUF177 domain-containing protein [Profundibacterium mesophilum]KAF0677527.1 hypothetical protein PMES_00032 [Profundibacterium mesophilum KAUST100406-0324]